ncbi:MAG: 50S ribosomal protein L11 methyltransferase [Humidesulfovibrio sp.]|uniref:50S ribosomal protein L11 methyltransferase n=1 Tax=Humidesulfovibrio sp. TaxID=2910988 RepID=UPI0027E658BA|nr:50S ribosomal protein L11 methyltransferase [Humidesulfovibrio sp.]MDQ7834475.1 50S ribosomal protein L11 methyltransferase [Humidesulfovibrio sp.]
MTTSLLKIEFSLPPADYDDAVVYLSGAIQHGWEESQAVDGTTHFSTYLENHDAGHEVARRIKELWPDSGIRTEESESQDWGQSWREFFTPIECGGRFEILPPWLSDEGHDNLTPIIIEPKMAFGTGHHPTTALCLSCLADLFRNGHLSKDMEFLDLGTGSGILGIGLAKLGLKGLGLDIDPQAIACADENARINNVEESFRVAVGGINAVPEGKTFKALVANILSKPLIFMAADIVRRIEPGGCLALSGILVEQAPDVIRAYVLLGLPEPELRVSGDWCALLWTSLPDIARS